jgi:hypothetical protein
MTGEWIRPAFLNEPFLDATVPDAGQVADVLGDSLADEARSFGAALVSGN